MAHGVSSILFLILFQNLNSSVWTLPRSNGALPPVFFSSLITDYFCVARSRSLAIVTRNLGNPDLVSKVFCWWHQRFGLRLKVHLSFHEVVPVAHRSQILNWLFNLICCLYIKLSWSHAVGYLISTDWFVEEVAPLGRWLMAHPIRDSNQQFSGCSMSPVIEFDFAML